VCAPRTLPGVNMFHILLGFLADESGVDLIEYTLLLAFICLASAAFFVGVGQNTSALWSITNARLASAASGAVSS
jgi:Flp pilus assembly pilin Flp